MVREIVRRRGEACSGRIYKAGGAGGWGEFLLSLRLKMFSVRAKLGGLYPVGVECSEWPGFILWNFLQKFIFRCFAGIIGFYGHITKGLRIPFFK